MAGSFKITIVPRAYPSYPPTIKLSKDGSPYVKFHTRIEFEDGTILDNYAGDWIFENKYYESLEKIFELLAPEVQECILFNLDKFRKI